MNFDKGFSHFPGGDAEAPPPRRASEDSPARKRPAPVRAPRPKSAIRNPKSEIFPRRSPVLYLDDRRARLGGPVRFLRIPRAAPKGAPPAPATRSRSQIRNPKSEIRNSVSSWVEVDLSAIRHNARAVKRRLGREVALIAVVKSDAYGHGLLPAARACREGGSELFAVRSVDEGERLRRAGFTDPILVLGALPPEEAPALVSAGLSATLFTQHLGEALAFEARRQGRPARVHVKVDTGMGRVGILPDDLPALYRWLSRTPEIEREGVYTHLACADEIGDGADFTRRQIGAFREALFSAERFGLSFRFRHAANSAAVLDHPGSFFNAARVGLLLYGLLPRRDAAAPFEPRPALSWMTRVRHLKKVAPGTPISYGAGYATREPAWIATLPVGYADGVPRPLSGRIRVRVAGRDARQVGAICMDQLLVEIPGDAELLRGAPACLLGGKGDGAVGVWEWAEPLGTVPYEITCGIHPGVPRRHLHG